MSISRVSTLSVFRNLKDSVNRSEQELVTHQKRISSTRIGNFYEDPVITSPVLQNQDYKSLITQNNNNLENVNLFINNTLIALDNAQEVLSNFKKDFLIAKNNDNYKQALFTNTSSQTLDTMVKIFNTNINGKYLFAGSAYNIKPINQELFTNPEINLDLDTTFFKGDTENLKYTDINNLDYCYNSNALDFVDMFKGLLLCKNAILQYPMPQDSKLKLEAAYNLINNSLDTLKTKSANIALVSNNINNQKQISQNYSDQYTEYIESKLEPDNVHEVFSIERANFNFSLSMDLLKKIIEMNKVMLQ